MNYYVTIWCLLALSASIKADGGLGSGGLVYAPGHASADYYAYPRYAFEYAVKDPHTGDNKAQWEKRDGDVVKGAYSLVEPDGSLRIVDYWADDKSGFNAVVKRIGPNLHPVVVPAAPIYKAPIPVLATSAIASPLSIGPIAKYSGLASAPLISGPLGLGGHGGAAVSTASLIKEAPMVISAPIVKPAPIFAPVPILKTSPYLASLPAPIISAPAPLLKEPIGISAVSLGDGLLKGPLGGYNYGLGLAKGGYDNYGLGLAKGGYDNYGLDLAKGGYDNYGLGLAKGGYDNYGLGLAKGGYDNYGLGLAKGGYDIYGLGLAKGGYDNYGLGLAKGGYNNYGLGLAKGGYDNYGLGLAKGGYDNYGLLAKGGYDNYGLSLAKGGYNNYGLGLAKGPILPLGGAWGGLGGLGLKH